MKTSVAYRNARISLNARSQAITQSYNRTRSLDQTFQMSEILDQMVCTYDQVDLNTFSTFATVAEQLSTGKGEHASEWCQLDTVSKYLNRMQLDTYTRRLIDAFSYCVLVSTSPSCVDHTPHEIVQELVRFATVGCQDDSWLPPVIWSTPVFPWKQELGITRANLFREHSLNSRFATKIYTPRFDTQYANFHEWFSVTPVNDKALERIVRSLVMLATTVDEYPVLVLLQTIANVLHSFGEVRAFAARKQRLLFAFEHLTQERVEWFPVIQADTIPALLSQCDDALPVDLLSLWTRFNEQECDFAMRAFTYFFTQMHVRDRVHDLPLLTYFQHGIHHFRDDERKLTEWWKILICIYMGSAKSFQEPAQPMSAPSALHFMALWFSRIEKETYPHTAFRPEISLFANADHDELLEQGTILYCAREYIYSYFVKKDDLKRYDDVTEVREYKTSATLRLLRIDAELDWVNLEDAIVKVNPSYTRQMKRVAFDLNRERLVPQGDTAKVMDTLFEYLDHYEGCIEQDIVTLHGVAHDSLLLKAQYPFQS